MRVTEENKESMFVWIGGGHLLVTVISFLISFGSSMSRFDTGAAASVGERVASLTFEVLHWPIVPLCMVLPIPLPGLIGWLPFLLNSALWAFCLYWIWRRFVWKRRQM